MKNALKVALGILTAIGGFLDVGAIATAAQAGASFRFQLVWAVLLGTLCVIFLVEMSGRLAAVSGHTLAAAVRERFGFSFFSVPFAAELAIDFLVLAAEIGGVCLALQLVTGVSFRWWALPVAFALWLLIWKGTFGLIENGTSALGLVTLAFVVGAVLLRPPPGELLAGLVPSLPAHDGAGYWFLAVGILGAIVSPYLLYFYSSGAIEDGWDEGSLGPNRVVAAVGMSFGCLVALGVLVVAAMVLGPRGIEVERYEQVALMLATPLGKAGFYLFAASLGIACFGAALEVALSVAYVTAQGFGWNFGEDLKPRNNARFATVYTVFLFASSLLMVAGIDPLKLTIFSMALTAVALPLVVAPLLVLMNDKRYLGEHTNGRLGNAVVVGVIALAFVLAIVAIPLQLLGG